VIDGPSLIAQSPRDLLVAELPSSGSAKTSPKEAAQKFEGLLMAQLFQSLRKTVEPSGLFGDGGQARQTYEYLFDQAVVEHAMASGQGWGLAERIEKDWARQQEKDAQKPFDKRDLKDSHEMPIQRLSR
jgi:Rod binding domain-containing protein